MDSNKKYYLDVIRQAKQKMNEEKRVVRQEIERLEGETDRSATKEDILTLLRAQTHIHDVNLLGDLQQTHLHTLFQSMEIEYRIEAEHILAVHVSLQAGLVLGGVLFVINRIVALFDGSKTLSYEWFLILIVVLTLLSLLFIFVDEHFRKKMIKLSIKTDNRRQELLKIIEEQRQAVNRQTQM